MKITMSRDKKNATYEKDKRVKGKIVQQYSELSQIMEEIVFPETPIILDDTVDSVCYNGIDYLIKFKKTEESDGEYNKS